MSAARAGPATSERPIAAAAPVARCEVDGEDIQKWLVTNGWALAFVRISHDYEADEKAAREAKGRDVAGRVHRAVGLARPQQEDRPFLAPPSRRRTPTPSCWRRPPDRSRPRPTAPSRATSTDPASASITQPTSRWYAKIQMKISKGTRWFCSVEEAEAAGCRETKR